MQKRMTLLALVLLQLCVLVPPTQGQTSRHPNFPHPAVQPRTARLQPLANFHQVTRNFYRSAQPNSLHLSALFEEYGVRTVISLKSTGRDESVVEGLPASAIAFEKFELHPRPWTSKPIWDRKQLLVDALRKLRLAVQSGPTLLHCTNGSDRTGLVTALYQILYEGWDKESAIREMEKRKYDFHKGLRGIPDFIRQVDIEELRREIGVR